jgi:hypothetical protein
VEPLLNTSSGTLDLHPRNSTCNVTSPNIIDDSNWQNV